MKKNINILIFFYLFTVLTSCAASREYKIALTSNSINAYENYQKKFPKSKYKIVVQAKLFKIYDESAWKNALLVNSLLGYKNYIFKFPNGSFVEESLIKIDIIVKQNEIKETWDKALKENTIEGFLTFINLYPNSSYVFDANSKIRQIKEDEAFESALNCDSIDSYTEYLKLFPNGKYKLSAKSKIEKFLDEQKILPFWEKAQLINTYESYMEFKNKYPYSSYTTLAKEFMQKIESRDWNKVCNQNTINSYSNFIAKYPESEYVEIAEKIIIDLEVESIFKGDFGKLPPMNKNSNTILINSTNTIEIYNKTKFTLTVRYSGIESKKIIILPYMKTTITLINGHYKVAATVNSSFVRNYAGEEDLTGGNYNSEYYIFTKKL